ncbi:hypothetical protein [Planktotalea frisia]|uniref:hypothetical protein n=1 Tax=Planktotalea frisia TaxID=696762 RepID=UPI0023561CA4|nr:hypothetical protein [Planktotalea frisia]
MSGFSKYGFIGLSAFFFAQAETVAADSTRESIRAAIKICTDIPKEIDVARANLLKNGWERTKEGALIALFNGMIASKFRAHDLDYTIRNAFFMSASILGNSSLGANQISMEFGSYHLALLGIREGSPYCVLSGPSELSTLNFSAEGNLTWAYNVNTEFSRRTAFALSNTHLISGNHFTEEGFQKLRASSDLSADHIAAIDEYLAFTTLHISPLEVQQ